MAVWFGGTVFECAREAGEEEGALVEEGFGALCYEGR